MRWPSGMPEWGRTGRARRQRGAVAVEFAFAFLLLFSVCYLVVAWVMLFTFQQTLNAVADDVARQSLGWAARTQPPAASQWETRVRQRVSAIWGAQRAQDVAVNTAQGQSGACPQPLAGLHCFSLVVSYPYRARPLVPLPAMPWVSDGLLPEQVSARAVAYAGAAP